MRSLLLEFLRFNNLATGIWREGDPYLVMAGTEHPVRQFGSPLDHERFLTLVDSLRYRGDSQERVQALKDIGVTASELLGVNGLADLAAGEFPLQLDLVVNPAEVAAVPFEAALDADGVPLFARPDKAVVITRRVRGQFAERPTRWPVKPRILFAWAQPSGVGEVPAAAHELALRQALAQWRPARPGTDPAPALSGLTVLANVTLADLAAHCATAAAASTPYTHVHLLAHGYPVGSGMKQLHGLALHDANGELEAVSPDQLIAALQPLAASTIMVTLAACDSANLTNTIIPRRSIAHELHVAGFPIVVASQFPLTVPGSTHLVERLYTQVLAGEDVRRALLQVRLKLHQERQSCGHDWASLVSYVRLPEGYQDHVEDISLAMMLSSLKSIRDQSDELLTSAATQVEDLVRLTQVLRERIGTLSAYLDRSRSSAREAVRVENLGLLGSAEKRMAELCFALGARSGDATWTQMMREAMARACEWYRQGYGHNLSKHWPGVQMLSLEAAIHGKFQHADLWHAAMAAARLAQGSEDADESIWGYGSRMELLLLAPVAGQPHAMSQALEAIAGMKKLIAQHSASFPIDSTDQQLQRYERWWTSENGFFPNRGDLRQDAAILRAALHQIESPGS